MFDPLFRAVQQLDDPVFLSVLWRSFALSLLAFLTLVVGCVWLLQGLVGHGSWLSWVAGALGGVGAMVLAVWLFVPAGLLIATLFLNRVAASVEHRFYPGLPAASGAPLAEQAWDGAALGARVLALQLVSLIASVMLPGVGFLLGWLVTGWAIGRGLFVGVAMRRMTRPQALEYYAACRLIVLVQGVSLALASSVPGLNLLVPVVGIAAMVHVFYRNSWFVPNARLPGSR